MRELTKELWACSDASGEVGSRRIGEVELRGPVVLTRSIQTRQSSSVRSVALVR